MASSNRAMSPGGALLRASRMFSLPPPLPPIPQRDTTGVTYNSPTATLPYPRWQTITTTESLRRRGDWGLKRPLPTRSTTKTSTPYLRIKHVDTIEHVTDFESAADHTLTLEKFQEMNVAVMQQQSKSQLSAKLPPCSVFEEDFDYTTVKPLAKKAAQSENGRWRYHGPWLQGMAAGPFKKYLKRKVAPRQAEFREYLRHRLAERKTKEAREEAQFEAQAERNPVVRPEDVSDGELLRWTNQLRENRLELFDFVTRFLDLAPVVPPSGTVAASLGMMMPYAKRQGPGSKGEQVIEEESPYAADGPPRTHPSAGIGYLRTRSYMANHPVYGPQGQKPALKARIVSSRSLDRKHYSARLGIGGFVGDTPNGEARMNARNELVRGINKFDPSIEGGAKVWVVPHLAHVDQLGRVNIRVYEAGEINLLVWSELAGERNLFEGPRLLDGEGVCDVALQEPGSSRSILNHDSNMVWSSSLNYGLSRRP